MEYILADNTLLGLIVCIICAFIATQAKKPGIALIFIVGMFLLMKQSLTENTNSQFYGILEGVTSLVGALIPLIVLGIAVLYVVKKVACDASDDDDE